MTIVHRGLTQISAQLWAQLQDNPGLKRALTATPKGQGREDFQVWHEMPDGSYLVPRFYLEDFLRTFNEEHLLADAQAHHAWKETESQFKGDLRDNQRDPVAGVLHALRTGDGVLLRADCGVGKTVMGIYIANELRAARVAILVDQIDIADQWADELASFCPGASIHIWGGGRGVSGPVAAARFTIIVAQTLWRQAWSETPAQFDLLIADEAHVLSAPCFFVALLNLTYTKSLALTATPEQQDGLEWVFQGALGTPVVEAAARLQPSTIHRYPFQTSVDHRDYYMAWCRKKTGMTTMAACRECPDFAGFPLRCGGSPPVESWTSPPRVLWSDKHNYTAYLQEVLRDPTYSDWLLDAILKLYAKGRQIMAFGQFQAPLIEFHKRFEEHAPGQSGLFFGRHAKAGRVGREYALDKPVTFCTYGVAEKALNVPWKDAAVFLSPRKLVKQIRGRIERQVEGKAAPIVIDPVHTNSPILSAMARRRLESYAQAQCSVIDHGL